MNVVKSVTTVALGVAFGAAIVDMGYDLADWQSWAWMIGLATLILIRDGAMARERDR